MTFPPQENADAPASFTTKTEPEPAKPRRARSVKEDDVRRILQEELRNAGVVRTSDNPNAPPALWTADGVGQVFVGAHAVVFKLYGLREMEAEEQKGLAEDSAYYLNARFPSAARFEPEARMLARLSGLWVPRMVERSQQQRAQEQAKKEDTVA